MGVGHAVVEIDGVRLDQIDTSGEDDVVDHAAQLLLCLRYQKWLGRAPENLGHVATWGVNMAPQNDPTEKTTGTFKVTWAGKVIVKLP